ncbi:hypothetical protein AB0H83_08670 [Dactylosporangium sp. NPDC050688]|uniref:hypothetical protein n=1 Tax=Dactylosporangium sp. NPDC050688 TaxID=3157217 RepID=UPI0033D552BE
MRQPVRWHDIARLMPELGITATVQVPPGHVLTALAAAVHPHTTTDLAIDDLGIPAVVHRLHHAGIAA